MGKSYPQVLLQHGTSGRISFHFFFSKGKVHQKETGGKSLKMKIYETRKGSTLKQSPRGRIRAVKYPEFLKGYIIFYPVYMHKRPGFRLQQYCGTGFSSSLKKNLLSSITITVNQCAMKELGSFYYQANTPWCHHQLLSSKVSSMESCF